VITVVLSVLVSRFGAPFVAAQIARDLKIWVRVERVRIGFPLSVLLTKLELKEFVAFDEITVYPSLIGMLAGKVVLNKVVVRHPVITLVRSADGTVRFPVTLPEQKGKAPGIVLAGLNVERGVVTFIDKTVSDPGYALVLESVAVDIRRASALPGSGTVLFSASAQIGNVKGTVPGTLSFSGWIDPGPRNMAGSMRIAGIEIASFAPYYGNMISAKKLTSGKLDFKADLKSKNNDLTADCHFELKNLVYAQDAPPEGSLGMPDMLPGALDFFADENGVIALDFPLRTRLDNPSIDPKVLQKVIMEAALRKLSNRPPEKNADSLDGVVDQFKKLKINLKGIFEE
jgi:hypothetical protein